MRVVFCNVNLQIAMYGEENNHMSAEYLSNSRVRFSPKLLNKLKIHFVSISCHE